MGKKASLKVQMLGDFVMSYQGKVIQMGRNQTTKVMQLLQLLLYAGPQGLTRLQIMEKLYNAKMEGDWANNLRVTVFHLRRLLEDTELPKEQYISTQNGRYCFVSSFPIEVDVVRFEELLEEAGTAKDEERGLELLKEACYYYKGYFLPSLSGEEWAVVAGAHFQNLYFAALEEVCKRMEERKEYTELLELSSRAAALYPFDEWQIWQIKCLMGLGRSMEAVTLYEKTTELYFNELNTSPSEKMLECFRQMSSQIELKAADFNKLRETLMENEPKRGAYCCSYPSFVDSYRMLARQMERTGLSIYLILCTLIDERRKKGSEREKELSEKLKDSIQEALRRGDIFTRYNLNQYLVILTGICKEECSIATNRIDACFRKREGSRRVRVSYRVASIMNIPETGLGVL